MAPGCGAVSSHHGSISPLSLSHLHPHAHTIITLLIQGKERLMLSAGTGHHKLFFLNRTKKHFPPTVASSPLSSLLSSSLMQSHGLCNYKAVLQGHRGMQGCNRFLYTYPTTQEAEEPHVIKEMRDITTTGHC